MEFLDLLFPVLIYIFAFVLQLREEVRTAACRRTVHCEKLLAFFPSPARMSQTNLSLGGNNLIFPAQGEFHQ
jgi:hypothetical protein